MKYTHPRGPLRCTLSVYVSAGQPVNAHQSGRAVTYRGYLQERCGRRRGQRPEPPPSLCAAFACPCHDFTAPQIRPKAIRRCILNSAQCNQRLWYFEMGPGLNTTFQESPSCPQTQSWPARPWSGHANPVIASLVMSPVVPPVTMDGS